VIAAPFAADTTLARRVAELTGRVGAVAPDARAEVRGRRLAG
jgi:hypothetical protein